MEGKLRELDCMLSGILKSDMQFEEICKQNRQIKINTLLEWFNGIKDKEHNTESIHGILIQFKRTLGNVRMNQEMFNKTHNLMKEAEGKLNDAIRFKGYKDNDPTVIKEWIEESLSHTLAKFEETIALIKSLFSMPVGKDKYFDFN